uniref:Outer clamp protein n=1 Tax=Piscine orthoreovirus TaxID=1157337 RepID=A0A190SAK3_9REOV|nr:outer clamp protein [Piscine orthoreovirus]
MANHRTATTTDFSDFIESALHGTIIFYDDQHNVSGEWISGTTRFVRIGTLRVCVECGHRIGLSHNAKPAMVTHQCDGTTLWDHSASNDWTWSKWSYFVTSCANALSANTDAYLRMLNKQWTEDNSRGSNDRPDRRGIAEAKRRLRDNMRSIMKKKTTGDLGFSGWMVLDPDELAVFPDYSTEMPQLQEDLDELSPVEQKTGNGAKVHGAGATEVPHKIVLRPAYGPLPVAMYLDAREDHNAYLRVSIRTKAEMVNMVRRMCYAGMPANTIKMTQGTTLSGMEEMTFRSGHRLFGHMHSGHATSTKGTSSLELTANKASHTGENLLKWSSA